MRILGVVIAVAALTACGTSEPPPVDIAKVDPCQVLVDEETSGRGLGRGVEMAPVGEWRLCRWSAEGDSGSKVRSVTVSTMSVLASTFAESANASYTVSDHADVNGRKVVRFVEKKPAPGTEACGALISFHDKATVHVQIAVPANTGTSCDDLEPLLPLVESRVR
ncbi:DUF3558 family protein [Actinosynnema sp. NPDC023587]|uniref:DUF3558 family protein n=1 Tax=Actinosynnema sp. NPDC023587 TaxID=3154695 RepID=UPI0033FA65C9